MMKCPVCKVKLTRKKYEDVAIHQCESCHGNLLKFNRLKQIETRRDKNEQELMDELVNAAEDNSQKIRCSNCMSNMEKRRKQIGPWDFTIDRCNKCQLIWLDAGELAKMQVVFESSEKGEEAERFRQRLKNMMPTEKAEYEERIANLPEENFAMDVIEGIESHWAINDGRFWGRLF